MGCSLILSGATDNSREELSGFGLYNRAIYDSENGEFLGCINYSQFWRQETGDRAFGIARAFGIMVALFSVMAFLLVTSVTFFTKRGKTFWWNMIRVFFLLGLISQACMYSIWSADICEEFNGTETHCVAGSDAVLGSFNCLILLTLVVFTSIVTPPSYPVFRLWKATDYDTEDAELSSTDDEKSNDKKSLGTSSNVSKASRTTTRSRRSHKSTRSNKSSRSHGGVSLLSMLSFRRESSEWEDGDIVEIVEEFAAPDKYGDSSQPETNQTQITSKIRSEFGPEGKKAYLETIHPDGSRTVKTLIDPSGNADLEALLRKEQVEKELQQELAGNV